ncbi:PaaI family thioesterase [Caulobacter segnis]
MVTTSNTTSVEALNRANDGKLPGWLGLEVTNVQDGLVEGRLPVRGELVAHTGYLLAGALLSVADILCAYGVSTVWPDGASGFTTAEVKCNFVGTIREGAALCRAKLLHGGRTTQVWDAEVTSEATGKLMAAFRCTQIILYPVHGRGG